jgi:alkylhydroperoxidase family enzyme
VATKPAAPSTIAGWAACVVEKNRARSPVATVRAPSMIRNAPRLADRADQVPDAIWDAAAEHFDEAQLGALVLDIATVNLWNRLHIATRQVVGSP